MKFDGVAGDPHSQQRSGCVTLAARAPRSLSIGSSDGRPATPGRRPAVVLHSGSPHRTHAAQYFHPHVHAILTEGVFERDGTPQALSQSKGHRP